MPVRFGPGVAWSDLTRAIPRVADRKRTRQQPAFRLAGSTRLNPAEETVADAVLAAFDSFTVDDASVFADGGTSTDWLRMLGAGVSAIRVPLQRQAIRSGQKGYGDGAAALLRNPDTQAGLRVVTVRKETTVTAVDAGPPRFGTVIPEADTAARTLAFNTVNPAYAEYATAHTAELVSDITIEARAAIRQAIGRAFTEQIIWQQTAATIREILSANEALGFTVRELHMVRGLTDRQAAAVQRRVRQTFEAAGKAGLSEAKAAKKALSVGEQYGDLSRKRRAAAIARTEIMRAANQGRKIGMDQLAADGLFQTNTAGKRWVTAPLDVCVICESQNNIVVPYERSFDLAGVDFPPAHTNCRCDWLLEPRAFPADTTTSPTRPSSPTPPPATPRTPANPVPASSSDELNRAARIYETAGGNSLDRAAAVYDDLGYTGLPKVVDGKRLAKHVDDGPVGELRRVVTPTSGVDDVGRWREIPADEVAETFRSGQHFVGKGLNGTGTYTFEGSA